VARRTSWLRWVGSFSKVYYRGDRGGGTQGKRQGNSPGKKAKEEIFFAQKGVVLNIGALKKSFGVREGFTLVTGARVNKTQKHPKDET